MLAPVDH